MTDTNRGHDLITGSAVILALEVFFFGLRVVSRLISRPPLGPDDVLVTIAFPLCLALDILLIVMVTQGGMGRHATEVVATSGPEKLIYTLKLQPAASILYLAAMAFSKLSILSLYLRIFVQKRWRIACRILQFVMVAYPLAYSVSILTICHPIRTLWSLVPPPGAHCGNINGLETYVSVPNIITDVAMLLLPFAMVWKVQISLKDRIAIGLTLCAGGMGLVFSCLRFHQFFTHDESLQDITYVGAIIGIYTALEAGGYFIAACVPVLRPIIDLSGKALLSGSWPGSSVLSSILQRRSSTRSSDTEVGRSGSQVSDSSSVTTINAHELGQMDDAKGARHKAEPAGHDNTYVAQVAVAPPSKSHATSTQDIVVQYDVSVTSEKRKSGTESGKRS